MVDERTPQAVSPTEGAASPSPRRRGRGVLAMVLIVVASLLLPLAAITVWVRNLMLNTDRYVETVRPLAHDPAVQEAVATRVGGALIANLDLQQRAQAALPERAKFLAAPIASGAQRLVHDTALRIVETQQFQTLWDRANERAHDQVVAALTGRDSDRIVNDNGKVVLRLGPLAAEVAQQLQHVGLGLPSTVDASRMDVRFVLIDSADLQSVQDYVKILDSLAWVLPILALLLYAGAVLVAVDRRVALKRVGIGATIAMVLAVVAYGFGRTLYLDSLPGPGPHPAGAVVFDTATRFVERGFKFLLVLGVVTWLAAWLAGPSRPATALRGQWQRLVGRAGAAGGTSRPGPVNRWTADHQGLLRGLLLAGLGLLLVTWDRPTGKVVLLLAVVGLVGLAAVQLLAAGGRTAGVSADA